MKNEAPAVIVVISDNTDPTIYGPYESAQAACDGIAAVQARLKAIGVLDHHVEAVQVRPLRTPL